MNITKISLTIFGSAALAVSASAAITGTFVAAVDGVNSFQSVDGGVTAFSSTTATTGLWHDRPGTFDIIGMAAPLSGAYQGQNKSGGAQTHNEVVTTLSGLLAGQSYDIYMVMGVSTSGSGGVQHIDAGFVSGALTTLLEGDGVDTGLGLMAGGGASWRAWEQVIGTTTANGAGEIQVFVGATANAERSVYNGLSYVMVPEPTSVMLLGLGGLAFLSRRRRA